MTKQEKIFLEKYKEYIYEESMFEKNCGGVMGILFAMERILNYTKYFKSLVEIEVAVAIIDMQIVLNTASHKKIKQLRKTIETFFSKTQIDFEENFDRERTEQEIEGYLNYREESTDTAETLEAMLFVDSLQYIQFNTD